jgi:antitoxin (DNA-binding transcriptional repressor) of toxin-antitoxin stability system
MLQMSLEEAKDCLAELINAVLRGETVVIVKGHQEAVQLVPAVPMPQRQFGSAKGLITMAEDFDAPMPEMDAYMP